MRPNREIIRSYLRISMLVLVLALTLATQSCVHQMVSHVEGIANRIDSLGMQRQRYITRSGSFDSPAGIEEAFFTDSTKNYDSLSHTESFPLRFQITKIESDSFPRLVMAKALVYDTLGKYIAGLAPPYTKDSSWRKYWVSLVDSCRNVAVPVTDFQVEEVRNNNNQPFAIYFVLDHSGSMASLAVQLQQSVKSVLYAIKKQDIVGVIKFANGIYEEVPLTKNRQEYRSKFQTNGTDISVYGSGTAMYQAVAYATARLDSLPPEYKKVIILFSDGADNGSKIKADSCIKLCRRSKTEVYSIAYLATTYADKSLPSLSRATNGRYYELLSKSEFPFVFRDIYAILNNYYRITYSAPPCRAKHYVRAGLNIFPNRNTTLYSDANYDKSIFDEFDPVGTVVLANIEFDFGSARVKPESMIYIEQIASAMQSNPSMEIRIAGHTDDIGTDEANAKLSTARANAVRHELEQMGIDPERIRTIGWGESKPLVPNDSEENRKRNRRTEFEILKK